MTTRCTDLNDEVHDVLTALTNAGTTKAGYAKMTIWSLVQKLDRPRRVVVGLIDDLQAAGFIQTRDGSVQIHHGCSCRGMLDTPGGSAVSRAGAQAGRRVSCSREVPPTPYGGRGNLSLASRSGIFLRDLEDFGEDLKDLRKISGTRRNRQSAERTPDQMSAYHLAAHFARRIEQVKLRRKLAWIGATNHKALGSQIARWMRDGVRPEQVHAMIEIFVTDPRWIRQGREAWRAFLGARQSLLNRVLANSDVDPHTTDASDWLESDPASGEDTDATDWLE